MFRLLKKLRRRPAMVAFERHDIGQDSAFDYLALASRCDSQNSFNRLHIELENVCAPAELARLGDLEKAGRLPPAGRAWVHKLRKLSPDLFDNPRPFVRRAIGKNFFFYRCPDSNPAERGLLVAITGNAQRLLLPVSMFLQAVDPAKWDVLVVIKAKGTTYLDGLEGVASDFPGVIDYIVRTFNPSTYRRTIVFGASNGGFPAAWAAVLMNAERGICVCGVLPNPVPPAALPPADAGDRPDLCFVYGRDSVRDADPAFTLQALYGGRLLPVPDIAVHNVLEILLERQELNAFMDRILS